MIAVSDFIRYVISDGGVTLLFMACAIWISRRFDSRMVRRTVLALALVTALLSVCSVSYLGSLALVGSFHPFVAQDLVQGRRTVVVILGSGSWSTSNWDAERFTMVDHSAAARVIEAIRVYRLAHPALIISSGGTPNPRSKERPSGTTMREALIGFGVPPDRIIVETGSRTTHDEAVIVAPMLRTAGAEQVILVTSEVHMRRSLGTFRAEGIDAIPAIARDVIRERTWTEWWLPSSEGLRLTQWNAHELLGIAYYRLRGWFR